MTVQTLKHHNNDGLHLDQSPKIELVNLLCFSNPHMHSKAVPTFESSFHLIHVFQMNRYAQM